MVGLLTSSGFRRDQDVLFWTSVCLTFSLYTFVLPVGTKVLGPNYGRKAKVGMPIFIVSAVVMAGFLLV